MVLTTSWALNVKGVKGYIAGVISLIEAPIGVLLLMVFLGTSISGYTVLGGLVILLSAVYSVVIRSK